MRKYLTRRFLFILLLMWLMTIIIFALMSTTSGGIERLYSLQSSSPFEFARLKSELKIDQSPGQQYFMWLGQVLQGNLGRAGGNRFSGFPISQLLAPKIQSSIILLVSAMILSVVTGFIFGSISALKPKSWLTKFINLFTLIGVSIPDFAIGVILMLVFAIELKWFPVSGQEGLLFDYTPIEFITDRIKHLILPAITLSFTYMATFTELFRFNLRHVMTEDYIRTARAKGLTERIVVMKHALRNSIIPVLATIFSSLPFFFGGLVVVEYLFSWPGVGLYIFRSLTRGVGTSIGDIYVVLIIIGAASMLSLLATLIADFIYAVVDPRVKSPTQSSDGGLKVFKTFLLILLMGFSGVMIYNWRLYAFYKEFNHGLVVVGAVLLAFIIYGIYLQSKNRISRRSRLESSATKETSLKNTERNFIVKERRYFLNTIKRMMKPSVIFGVLFFVILILASIIYLKVMGYSVVRDIPMDLVNRYSPPSVKNPMGTNMLGQGILTIILMYSINTLKIVTYVTAIGVIGGTLIGVMLGFFKGILDKLVLIVFDLISAIPSFFLVILVLGLAGNSEGVIILSSAVFGLIEFAKVVRARVLVIREFNYVEAARALGNSELQIVLKHLARNLFSVVWEQGMLLFGRNMLLLSSLGFLNILQTPNWGKMVGGGTENLNYWWLSVFPILMIFLSVLAVNAIGKGVNKALDPFEKDA